MSSPLEQGNTLTRIANMLNRQFRELDCTVHPYADGYPWLKLDFLPGELWRLDYERTGDFEGGLRRTKVEAEPGTRFLRVIEGEVPSIWGFDSGDVFTSTNYIALMLGLAYVNASNEHPDIQARQKAIRGAKAFSKEVRRYQRQVGRL